MFKVPILKFTLFTCIGSFIWSWILALIGFKLGENWETIGEYLRKADYAIAALAIAFVVWWVWGIYKEHRKVNSL